MNANRSIFLRFSEELTAYTSVELEGTGMVDTYQALVEGATGSTLLPSFYALASAMTEPTDPVQQEDVIANQGSAFTHLLACRVGHNFPLVSRCMDDVPGQLVRRDRH